MFISVRHEMGQHHGGEGGKGRQCLAKTAFFLSLSIIIPSQKNLKYEKLKLQA